ncbi:metallophosphoesterase [Aeromicrobium camelliae]|uniref:Metallophosphoesterase n=2 Tax=Aeromicrobium TaxID=2040 RepID=A0A3N6YXT6_9ACTN|nr:metallophosphoesterase family protein [Aeromicrobium camelliae]RQN02571.1 metallophosphoesterase [Aeromicrobium camelliae]
MARRALRIGLVVLVGLVVGLWVAAASFLHTDRSVTVGAHAATVSGTFDGHATVQAGPLLPEFRLPSGAPLGIGATIVLHDSPITNFEEILARDAAIAAAPEGEIAKVEAELRDVALESAVRGLAAGIAAVTAIVVVWRLVGRDRRAELAAAWPPSRGTATVGGTLAVVLVASVWVALPHDSDGRNVTWVPIAAEFPELDDIPADTSALRGVEVSKGAAVTGGKALLDGAIATYSESVEFYGDLAAKVEDVDGIRAPEGDEVTALVVTDRHDNITMDQVAKAIADRADISFVMDLGDDTSNGASWEDFSIRSLATTFEDYPVYAVAGNHDQGPYIREEMERAGFTVLDGEIEEFEGIALLGDSDPRSSGLTAGYTGNEGENIDAIGEQSTALAETACEADERVGVLMVHSSASARETVERGCADLVLSGHLHRQVGPTETEGDDGITTSLTTASTGGAVYAFALGSKLRRDAQVTLVTFDDGRPVGLQIVTLKPGAIIEVGDYTELTLSDLPDDDSATSTTE